MASISAEALSGSIGDIYAAAHGTQTWDTAVEGIRSLFHGSKACIFRFGPDLQSYDAISTNADPHYTRMVIDHLQDDAKAFGNRVGLVPLGRVYRDVDVMGQDQLRASRFWNEWMAPQDMYGGLGVRLMAKGPSRWFFDVQRGARQEAFGSGDAETFGLLVPHLLQALRISKSLQLGRGLAESVDRLNFGMLMVDGNLRILTSNAAAESILEDPASPLRRRAGRLSPASGAGDDIVLKRLVAQVCPASPGAIPMAGGDLVLKAGGERPDAFDLVLSVSPADGAAANAVSREAFAAIAMRRIDERPVAGLDLQLRRVYGLSLKESRVALGLVEGLALGEVAAAEGIAISTARSHLEAIFLKTGVSRQGQLVALLKTVEPLHRREFVNGRTRPRPQPVA